MKQVLVRWSSNWSDEIDYEGSAIMDQSELDDLKEKIASLKNPFNLRVGVEKYIDYKNGEELLSEISEEPISKMEAEIIINRIGCVWGDFLCFDQVDDWLKEQNEYTN